MKTNTSIVVTLGVALGLLLACPSDARAAGPQALKILVCQPGGPNLNADEQQTLDELYGYLGDKLGMGKGSVSGVFLNERQACDAEIAKGDAQLMLMPTSLIVDHMDALGLEVGALLKKDGRVEDSLYLMAAKDAAGDLAAYKGKTITGTTLGSPRFVANVVFEGALGAAGELVLQPAKMGLRGIRKVTRGKVDAVLLDGEQYRALAGSPWEAKLKLVHTSKAVPNPAVMVVKAKVPAGFTERLRKVLLGMASDEAGKKVLSTFKLDGFEAAAADRWAQAKKRHKGGS